MAQRPISPILIAAALAALGLIAAVGLSFLPVSNWTWGIDLLRYYPAWFRFTWLGLGLVGLAAAWRWPQRMTPSISLNRWPPAFLALLAGLLAGIVFHLARARTGLLGDGYQILVDLRQGHPPTERSPLYNLLEPALVSWQRPGGVPSLTEAGLLSTLLGGVTIGILVWVVLRRARTTESPGGSIGRSSLVVMILLGCQPALQLFFGYVECYALVAVAILLFLLGTVDRCEGRGSLMLPFLAVILAGISHPFGLLLVPAFLVLAASGPSDGRWRRLLGGSLLLLLVFGCLALLAPLWPAGADGRTPLKYLAPAAIWGQAIGLVTERIGTSNRYGLDSILTLRQLADVLNHLWLTAAPALVLLAGLATTGRGRRALAAPAARVALTLAVSFVVLRAAMRTLLGPMRDWDLFAGAGLAVTGWAALAAAAWIDNAGQESAAETRGAISVVLVSTLLFVVPWIGIQANSGRAVARHLALVDATPALEPAVAATFHSAMGLRFLSLGDSELAASAFERAWQIRHSWNFAWRAGLAYLASGKPEKAAAAMTEVTKARPDDWRGWSELGNAWSAMDRFDLAEPALRRAIFLDASATAPRIHLARTLGMLGRGREARSQIESVRPMMTSTDPLQTDFILLDRTLAPLFNPPASPIRPESKGR